MRRRAFIAALGSAAVWSLTSTRDAGDRVSDQRIVQRTSAPCDRVPPGPARSWSVEAC